MLAQGNGTVISLASQAATVALPGHLAYCASKFGLVGLTKVLALEWAGRGVTANTISPTVVMTLLAKELWDNPEGDALKAQIHPEVRRARRDRCRRCLPGQRRCEDDQWRRPAGRRRLHHSLKGPQP